MNHLIINESSAVYKLFNLPFHCRVAYYTTLSYDQIEKYGTYYSHDAETSAHAPVDKWLTIAQITDNFISGIGVELVNPKDTEIIYTLIIEHLTMWRDYGLDYGVPYDPPMDDLKALDALAQAIRSRAYHHGNIKEKQSDIFDLLNEARPLYEDNYSFTNVDNYLMNEIESLFHELGGFSRYGC